MRLFGVQDNPEEVRIINYEVFHEAAKEHRSGVQFLDGSCGNYRSRYGRNSGLWNLIGIKAMFYDFGIPVNTLILFVISVLMIITIYHYCYDINMLNLLGILEMIGLLFVQTHQYDIFVLATILPYYFVTIRKHDYFKFVMLCLVFIAINFPRKILLLSNYRILHPHRDVIVIMLLLSQFIHWDRIWLFKKPNPALIPV